MHILGLSKGRRLKFLYRWCLVSIVKLMCTDCNLTKVNIVAHEKRGSRRQSPIPTAYVDLTDADGLLKEMLPLGARQAQ